VLSRLRLSGLAFLLFPRTGKADRYRYLRHLRLP